MVYDIDNIEYKVVIQKKGNKNTYIRVEKDLTILITTHYFVTKKQIIDLLDRNQDYLRNIISKRKKEQAKEAEFYYLGLKYDIIIVPTLKDIDFSDTKIFVSSNEYLNKWYKKQIIRIFNERLENNFQLFNEQIPFPKLKMRKMKTRWGVCNRKNNSITLNTELVKLNLEKIDYVIIHELSHFVHFNHSKEFWNLVSKYCSNYKEIRRSMRE